MEIIRMKARSLFVCKWEIDYIYLLAQKLRTAHLTHTHTHIYMYMVSTHTKKSERHPQRVWSSDSCFFLSALRPSPSDRGTK